MNMAASSCMRDMFHFARISRLHILECVMNTALSAIKKVLVLFHRLQPLVAAMGWDLLSGKTMLRQNLMQLLWTSKSQVWLEESSLYENRSDEVFPISLKFGSANFGCGGSTRFPMTNFDELDPFCAIAIRSYNEKNNSKYEFLKVEKADGEGITYFVMYYHITFLACENAITRTFQTKACMDYRNRSIIEIEFCDLLPKMSVSLEKQGGFGDPDPLRFDCPGNIPMACSVRTGGDKNHGVNVILDIKDVR
ncbi:hypothetical protein CCACVL1_01052 [Corchorus capsularis]|uniref:Uncharacterized protein n=1 Tax=Corchorus capsularis TaxID=210143 RepID=A0A1R3KRJ9_COCAP|nr:hypothetical protein CCACVL1_01052 [Corchorus capsularis]